MNNINKEILDILSLTKDKDQIEAINRLKGKLIKDINNLKRDRKLLDDIVDDVRRLKREDRIIFEKKEYSKVEQLLDDRIENILKEMMSHMQTLNFNFYFKFE